ncbi:hypothetical protein D8S78_15790 [Natrialba swarupiae]|nr:hypothetical protein [Natrialba swarupiae]
MGRDQNIYPFGQEHRYASPRRALTATGGIVLAGCFDADGGSPTDDSRPGSGGASTTRTSPSRKTTNTVPATRTTVRFRLREPRRTVILTTGRPTGGVRRDRPRRDGDLEPSAETVEEGDRVTFELHNRSAHRFSHNPYRWIVHKLVDGGWFYVGPREFPEPESRLDPDESRSWELRIENDAVDNGRSIGKPGTIERDPLVGLGGGEYAFGTRGGFVGDTYDGSIGFLPGSNSRQTTSSSRQPTSSRTSSGRAIPSLRIRIEHGMRARLSPSNWFGRTTTWLESR